MLTYELWGRMNKLPSGVGDAKKEDILSLDADRLSQQIFSLDGNRLDHMKDGATSYITSAGLQSRLQRDLAMDWHNPREELPHNPSDNGQIDMIPNLIAQQVDLSHPADYEADNNIKLVQQAYQNSLAEESKFSDPKAMTREQRNAENPAGNRRGKNVLEAYSFGGSAAGRPWNHLETDEDGAIVDSVESSTAF